MAKETMYLMKMQGLTDATNTPASSVIKIPKGQILSEIEQGSIKDNTVSVVKKTISLDDTILSQLDKRVYTQRVISVINNVPNNKPFDIIFTKDSNGNWFTNKYYKYDAPSETSIEVTRKAYILSRASMKAYMNLDIKNVNQSGAEIFKFLVNPQNINFTYAKSVNKALTSAGWTFQHWGNDIPTIDVKGTTLMLQNNTNVVPSPWEKDPIMRGQAYQNLETLRSWYWEQNKRRNPYQPDYRIGLSYRGVTYIGHFENFSFTEDAEKPRQLDYSFKFLVEEEHGDGALLGDTKDSAYYRN